MKQNLLTLQPKLGDIIIHNVLLSGAQMILWRGRMSAATLKFSAFPYKPKSIMGQKDQKGHHNHHIQCSPIYSPLVECLP